jgi:MFS family permease
MIGSPLATMLMNYYATPTSVGVWETFVTMGLIYFVFMLGGAFGYRLPEAGWKPAGWTPPVNSNAMITTGNVHLKDAHKTVQFWLIWAVLCLNVSAGIGIIGAASPMLQETFGGRLFGDPSVGFAQFSDDQKAQAALVGAAFVGLFSLFNIAGRFFWASLSDKIGRKLTYFTFFSLGFLCYAAAPTLATLGMLAVFAAAFCLIASMYGGGFATIPAYLADIFGTQFVGAIHGRLLTAWSTAGIVGPVIVNYMHDSRVAAGVPPNEIYHPIFYVLAGLLVAGFIANLLIRPLDKKWFMSDEEVAALQAKLKSRFEGPAATAVKAGFDLKAMLAWAAVGIPLAWGIWITLEKALVLFK